MNKGPDFRSLVAPNIFDASADSNLLLYLVASNLLSSSTWALADKIRTRAAGAGSVQVSSARLLLVEIQRFMDRNFRHLHANDVGKLYGEFDITEEGLRLGVGPVETVVNNAITTWETMIRVNNVPREALQPAFDLVAAGRFPAYWYGNIDLVRANRRLTGKSHASVLGLTSCVDEIAIFAALAMTMPRGSITSILALNSPSHASAFGWNGDGEAWWFYGKNRLLFAEDWQALVTQSSSRSPQAVFDDLHGGMNRVVSAAGTFDLDTGASDLSDERIVEIVAKMDRFFGVRLRQVDAALARPRRQRSEDPLAPYLRALLGSSDVASVAAMLEENPGDAAQGVLYAFRSLFVKDPQPYLDVARSQPNCLKLAHSLSSCDSARDVVAAVAGRESVLGDRNRIAMPDETLRFKSGTDRDKALLLHVLLEKMGGERGCLHPVTTLICEAASYVGWWDLWINAGSGRIVERPHEPVLVQLG